LSRTERWVDVLVAALAPLGGFFHTKLLFVTGIVLCVAIGLAVTRAIIRQFRQNSHRGVLSRILKAIPLAAVLLFVYTPLYLALHELLRAGPR
jgi:hypothetical protein